MTTTSVRIKRCRVWIASAVLVLVCLIIYQADIFELRSNTFNMRQFQADVHQENAKTGHSPEIFERLSSKDQKSKEDLLVPQRAYEKQAQVVSHLAPVNIDQAVSQGTYESNVKQAKLGTDVLQGIHGTVSLESQHIPRETINAGLSLGTNVRQPQDLRQANTGIAYTSGIYEGQPQQVPYKNPGTTNEKPPRPPQVLTQANTGMGYSQGIYEGQSKQRPYKNQGTTNEKPPQPPQDLAQANTGIAYSKDIYKRQPKQRTYNNPGTTNERPPKPPQELAQANTGIAYSQGTYQGQPQLGVLQQRTFGKQAVPHQTQVTFTIDHSQEHPGQTQNIPHQTGNIEMHQDKTDSRVILLPLFSLLTDPAVNNSNYKDPNKVGERMLDFVESTNYSLFHPYVAEVHLMYTQDAMPGYITEKLGNHPKLKFKRVNSTYMWGEVIEYVHTTYRNQLVLLTNGDVYPGEGLELLNYTKMSEKRLFYSPTRHSRKEKRCTMKPGYCDKGVDYSGSHDTYIFIPKGEFPVEARRYFKGVKLDSWASENIVLWLYKVMLKYNVLNPCHVIFMYHNHCSKLRHTDRKRLEPVFYSARPSANLE